MKYTTNTNTIYLIINKIGQKPYVGQTWMTIENRWRTHFYLNSGCIKLKNALEKYGKDKFTIEIIAQCSDQQIANYLEDFYIEEYDSIKNGYNIKSGGSNGKHSVATRQKMSKSHIGKPSPMKGKSSPIKGVSKSEAHKKKLSDAHKGKSPWNKGKTFPLIRVISPETRIIIREEYAFGKISMRKLAKKYNVSKTTISKIIKI
jgi:group I intron endonuclease